MKSFISLIIAAAILIGGALYESFFVKSQFNEFHEVIEVLEEKADKNTLTKEDCVYARDNWYSKKEYLHIFIPHNEIKELDLWINETVTYAEEENFEECKAKLVVIKELLEIIPKTFTLRIENIL